MYCIVMRENARVGGERKKLKFELQFKEVRKSTDWDGASLRVMSASRSESCPRRTYVRACWVIGGRGWPLGCLADIMIHAFIHSQG